MIFRATHQTCIEGYSYGESEYIYDLNILIEAENKEKANKIVNKYIAKHNLNIFGGVVISEKEVITEKDVELNPIESALLNKYKICVYDNSEEKISINKEYYYNFNGHNGNGKVYVLDNREDFEKLCSENNLYYDFVSHVLIKNNKLAAHFFSDTQSFDWNIIFAVY